MHTLQPTIPGIRMASHHYDVTPIPAQTALTALGKLVPEVRFASLVAPYNYLLVALYNYILICQIQ
jgi:hypothetical protein